VDEARIPHEKDGGRDGIKEKRKINALGAKHTAPLSLQCF